LGKTTSKYFSPELDGAFGEARSAGSDIPILYKGNVYWQHTDKGYSDRFGSMPTTYTFYTLKSGDDSVKEAFRKSLLGFRTGGLADFTGPAWLDGTPSKPEYILNATQTERFFSLIDILEGFDTNDDGKKTTGDNYFDIEINVDKLESDYDVEQVADKIRRMIYEDATYRNVNAINHIR
jgi:hypothetical protein